MLAELPVPLHVIECVVPAVQFSPPLGAVTDTVGRVTGELMVKLAALVLAAKMVPPLFSARTRMRAWVVFSVLAIVQLKLRALGSYSPFGVRSFAVPAAGHVAPPSALNAIL